MQCFSPVVTFSFSFVSPVQSTHRPEFTWPPPTDMQDRDQVSPALGEKLEVFLTSQRNGQPFFVLMLSIVHVSKITLHKLLHRSVFKLVSLSSLSKLYSLLSPSPWVTCGTQWLCSEAKRLVKSISGWFQFNR